MFEKAKFNAGGKFEILKSRLAAGGNKTTNKNLFNENNNENIETIDKINYLSILMSTFYLAKKIKPEILTSLSYLATKSHAPTIEVS
jgi:hypothetical protein